MKLNNPVFIFARGGSKGIKNKNIKLIKGKPLINYTIEFALKNKNLGKVFVSTDDSKIIKIAKKYPIEIIKRPLIYAKDESKEIYAWKHALKHLIKKGYLFDKMIILPVTSPLRINSDISKALKVYDDKTDVVISLTKSNKHPSFNMVKLKGEYAELALKPYRKIYNRQLTSTLFDMTTLFYIVKVEFLTKNNYMFDGKIKYVEIPKSRSLDIDDKHDLEIAKLLIK